MGDVELLEQHRGGSESAFADLVRRHISWVYGVARRRLRDAHLAEDVTQGVFVLLHRNAPRFANDGALIGWLHRAAWYSTENAARTERRRQRREREAAAMMQSQTTPEGDSQWEQLAPLLDKLIEKLSRADREAILLRYYRDQSFAEVASQIGTTPEAARKRVERAVEKLRQLAGENGAVLSAGVLATHLTNLVRIPVPPGLIAVSTTAATSSAVAGFSAAIVNGASFTMVSAKVALILGVIAGAGLLIGGGIIGFEMAGQTSQPAINQPSLSPLPPPTNVAVAKTPQAQSPAGFWQGYPQLAPYSAVRWNGQRPEVQLNGAWFELTSIDNIPTSKIIEFTRTLPEQGKIVDYRKHFEEDLVEILTKMGHAPAGQVDLGVRDLSTGDVQVMQNVRMTDVNRAALRDANTAAAANTPNTPRPKRGAREEYRRISPFNGIRWEGEAPSVEVNGTWYEWLAIDDLPIGQVVEFAKKEYGPALWQKRVGEDLVEVLTTMKHPPGDAVKLKLRLAQSGEEVTLPAVQMTEENRQAVMQGPNAFLVAVDTPVSFTGSGAKDVVMKAVLAAGEGDTKVLTASFEPMDAGQNQELITVTRYAMACRQIATRLFKQSYRDEVGDRDRVFKPGLWVPDLKESDEGESARIDLTSFGFGTVVVHHVGGAWKIDPAWLTENSAGIEQLNQLVPLLANFKNEFDAGRYPTLDDLKEAIDTLTDQFKERMATTQPVP